VAWCKFLAGDGWWQLKFWRVSIVTWAENPHPTFLGWNQDEFELLLCIINTYASLSPFNL
jgi:hypothetical protein